MSPGAQEHEAAQQQEPHLSRVAPAQPQGDPEEEGEGQQQDEVEDRVGDGEDALEQRPARGGHRPEDRDRDDRGDHADAGEDRGPLGDRADREARLAVGLQEHEEGGDQERVGEQVVDVGHGRERRLVPHQLEGGQAQLSHEGREQAEREEEPRRAGGVAGFQAISALEGPRRAGQQVDELQGGSEHEEPVGVSASRVEAARGESGPAHVERRRPAPSTSQGRALPPVESAHRLPSRAASALPCLGDDRGRLVAPEEDVEAARPACRAGPRAARGSTVRPAMPSFWQWASVADRAIVSPM